jgi:hypothetical protein
MQRATFALVRRLLRAAQQRIIGPQKRIEDLAMLIVYVALTLILIALGMFMVGKGWLVYYGFKDSPGIGLGTLLVPAVTLWFAFYRLEKEGKELWIALWASGAVIATITTLTFLPTVLDVVAGKAFEPNYGSVQAAPIAPTPTPEATPTPAPTPEATPTPAPTPEATPTPAPTPEATPTPAPTPEATPTPAPVVPADGAAPAAP